MFLSMRQLEGLHQVKVRAFKRGGNWNNTSNAGVFTLNLNNAPTNSNTNISFRCARYVSTRISCSPEQYRQGDTSELQIHTDVILLLDTCDHNSTNTVERASLEENIGPVPLRCASTETERST
jgi:hypothetical protein